MVVRGEVVDDGGGWVVGYQQSSKQLLKPQSSIFIDSAIDVGIGAWPAATTPEKQKNPVHPISQVKGEVSHTKETCQAPCILDGAAFPIVAFS
ncbi:hypothetical protein L2E82_18903 [Cichorium intybus]|uniref:Uncharacterized protein n=1 Tax=Cichorium intybus TaxID=13427 RepID=A0ACB9FBG6_CICIN|nr:hypothetical protein L2E82_18903 [Cichorium intybus]